MEVMKLASGTISDDFRVVIEARDVDKRRSFPTSTQWYLRELDNLRRADPSAFPKIKVYQDVLDHFSPDLPKFVAASLAQQPTTDRETRELAARLDSFPAIRSHVRLWFYMMFICIKERTVPGMDKLDDYRHVVEASYCDAFVTNDDQLGTAAPLLHPGLDVIRWEELQS
jgi:hypothetical protein